MTSYHFLHMLLGRLEPADDVVEGEYRSLKQDRSPCQVLDTTLVVCERLCAGSPKLSL